MHPHTLDSRQTGPVHRKFNCTNIQIGVAHQTQFAETIHALQCNATCPHQMRHCSRSLSPDGLDFADHIKLSFCLQLLN